MNVAMRVVTSVVALAAVAGLLRTALADDPRDDVEPRDDAVDEPEAGLSLAFQPPARATPEAAPEPPPPLWGLRYERAPSTLPGPAVDADPDLEDVRRALLESDPARAKAIALAMAERGPRNRDVAWFVVGWMEREGASWGRAADAFARVRASAGPLARLAAWYEAEAEHRRGRHSVAITRCERIRQTWPDGEDAKSCLRIIARGHASLGATAAARAAAAAWDTANPKAPIAEQVELDLALALAAAKPLIGVERLRDLALHYRQPLSGRLAEEALEHLARQGVPGAGVPDDDASLLARAVSAREAGRNQLAWALFEEVRARGADAPHLARWVAENEGAFAWRTRHFDVLAARVGRRYDATPTGADAWKWREALGRAGRWDEAATVAEQAQVTHANTREWRSSDELARTFLLGGRPELARDVWDSIAARGGYTGRRAELYAGFAALRAGDLDGAVARFDGILARDREHLSEAHYWRATAHDRRAAAGAPGAAAIAAADRAWVRENDPYGWYGVLLQSRGPGPSGAPWERVGRWPGAQATPAAPVQVHATRGAPLAGPLGSTSPASPAAWTRPWSELSTSPGLPVDRYAAPARDPLAPPRSNVSGPLYDEGAARELSATLVREHGTATPDLAAIHALASAGLHDLSGPLFSTFYEQWLKDSRAGRAPAAAIDLQIPDWRALFLWSRDHHHAARFVYGLERDVTPDLTLQALRLGWPVAHERAVWRHAEEADVDPWMVLGLMRQESTYSPIAVSPVGARGAMQIMPRTGHLLADLAHDPHYSGGDLEDPLRSVEMGIGYLGLLLDRFDGNFPLAVASYNGGPHNVGAWLESNEGTPTDELVEMIPFKETRNYVKVVTSNYATYLALYEPPEAMVRVPARVSGNHPEIVDF